MGTIREICQALWQLLGLQSLCKWLMELRAVEGESGDFFEPIFQLRGSQDEHAKNVGWADMPQDYPEGEL